MQPVARYIKKGLEQSDIHDTDEAIQQQADDNTADLEDLHLRKKKEDEGITDTSINELSNPSQIDDMIKSTTTSNSRGYLRGSRSSTASSSSAAAAAIPSEEEAAAIPSEEEADDTPPPVNQIVKQINMIELEKSTKTFKTSYTRNKTKS